MDAGSLAAKEPDKLQQPVGNPRTLNFVIEMLICV